MANVETLQNVFISVGVTAGTSTGYTFDINDVHFQPDEVQVTQVLTFLSAGTTPHYLTSDLVDNNVLAMFPTSTTATQHTSIVPFKWVKSGIPTGSYKLTVKELDGTDNTMTGTVALYLRFVKYKRPEKNPAVVYSRTPTGYTNGREEAKQC